MFTLVHAAACLCVLAVQPDIKKWKIYPERSTLEVLWKCTLFKWSHVPKVHLVLFWGDSEVCLPLPPFTNKLINSRRNPLQTPTAFCYPYMHLINASLLTGGHWDMPKKLFPKNMMNDFDLGVRALGNGWPEGMTLFCLILIYK